jgi:hypothetical protein
MSAFTLICALLSSRRGVHVASASISRESSDVEWHSRGIVHRHTCPYLLEQSPVQIHADIILVCQKSLRDTLLRTQSSSSRVVLVERPTPDQDQGCEAIIHAYTQRPILYVQVTNPVTNERELMPSEAFFDQFKYKPEVIIRQ